MDWTHWLTGALLLVSTSKVTEPAVAGYWTFDPHLSDRAMAIRRIDSGAEPRMASPSAAPDAGAHDVRALLQEATDVQEHLTIAPIDAEAVLIVDGHGISRLYHTNGEPEAQEFEAGSARVRTFWAQGELRQEFELAPGTRLFRAFRSDRDRARLIEMIAVESSVVPPTRPLIRVYGSDRLQ